MADTVTDFEAETLYETLSDMKAEALDGTLEKDGGRDSG